MSRDAIYSETVRHFLSPIRRYLEDASVAEVMINNANEIYIEKGGQLTRVPETFADQEGYEAAVNNILQYTGKSLYDEASLIDARLPDGSRVHVAKSPCSRFGMAMTIRKFAKSMLDLDWLVQIGSMTPQVRAYLDVIVKAEANVLVAGGTSSGKTSLLNAMSTAIPSDQRVVVIEDSSELQLQQEHVISMETQAPDRYGRGAVSIRDLFRSSLRLRPDRIVIGEVRGGEALEMIQAMTSGHGGSMGTLHANHAYDALGRLETMAMMNEVDLPLYALRSQIASAIDVVVQLQRHHGRRLLTEVAEVETDLEDGRYQIRQIFRLETAAAEEGGEAVETQVWTGKTSLLRYRMTQDLVDGLDELTRPIFQVADRVEA